MPALRARVKFFLDTRRVVAMAVAKDIGSISVKAGAQVRLDGVSRTIKRTIIRKVSLGAKSRHSMLVFGFKYERPTTPLGDIDIIHTAQLLATITNDPPDGGDEEDLSIDETENNPQLEEDDAPEMPDDEVLYNG